MANIHLKIGFGAATAGILSGGTAYGFHKYNDTTNTVENYLRIKGFEPISSEDSSFWSKVLETYKLENTEETAIQSTEVTSSDEIKNWCETNLKNKIKSTKETLFQKASKWCVNYFTIEEIMKDVYEADPVKLKGKYENLEEIFKKLIDKLYEEESDNGKKIQKWCESNKKRRFVEDDDDDFFSTSLFQVCVKSEAGNDS